MKKFPVSFSVSLIFILVNAFIWLAFATIVAVGAHPALPDSEVFKWTLAILAFGTAGTLTALYFLLKKRSAAAFYLATGLLLVISVLILLDQFGLPDLMVLLITLTPLALLLKNRAWYFQRGLAAQHA